MTWFIWAVNGIILGVEGKGERRENSNGSVLVVESYLIVLFVTEIAGAGGGVDVSESELSDEKIIWAFPDESRQNEVRWKKKSHSVLDFFLTVDDDDDDDDGLCFCFLRFDWFVGEYFSINSVSFFT